MKVSSKSINGIHALSLDGKFDTNNSSQVEMQLSQLIESNERRILINLEHLDYISSAGLRVLLAAAKRLRANEGQLRICGVKEMVKEIFEISGFDRIFDIYDTETDALENFL